MPSSQLDLHQNSWQFGMVKSFTAFTATSFVPNFSFYVTATFCPLDGNCKSRQKIKIKNFDRQVKLLGKWNLKLECSSLVHARVPNSMEDC